MVFSSNLFVFLFLPLFLSAYYLTPGRWRNWTILLGSYLFYAWWRPDFLLLFVAITLWNYVFALAIQKYREHPRCFYWLVVGVAGDLAALGYFKYANFGVDSISALMVSVGLNPFYLETIILPLGISFYTFQALAYLVAEVWIVQQSRQQTIQTPQQPGFVEGRSAWDLFLPQHGAIGVP